VSEGILVPSTHPFYTQTLSILGSSAPRQFHRSHQFTDPPSIPSVHTHPDHVRRLLVPHTPGIRSVRPRPSLSPGTALIFPLTTEACDSILCATRDEYLARPTLPAHFHSFEALSTSTSAPAASSNNDGGVGVGRASGNGNDIKSRSKGSVLSGRDLRAEGTWLGISQLTGRVALL
jgi:hypothetical protein